MNHYTPRTEEMHFVLSHVLRAPAQLQALPAFTEVDPELMQQVLEEAGKFVGEVVAPLNRDGEVSEFLCLPVSDVLRRLRQHEFTPDAACATAVALT